MYYEIFDTTMDISGASVPRGRAIFLRYDYTRRSQYGVSKSLKKVRTPVVATHVRP